MVARLSVKNSRELMTVLLAIRAAPTEIQKAIRQQIKTFTTPELTSAMAEQLSMSAGFRMQDRVLIKTARVTMSNQNVRLSSATVGRKLKGGMNPKTDYAAAEFGADRQRRSTYSATSRKGRTFNVTRHTTRQLPLRNKKGWVFWPAVAELVPRVAAVMVQTTVRVISEAFEGRRS